VSHDVYVNIVEAMLTLLLVAVNPARHAETDM
jgi:hypothetical protein